MHQLNITHLYPAEMNLYGDLGNVICLQKRCEWRGIKVKVRNIGLGESLETAETDIYFFGGGQDADQLKIYPDLVKLKSKELLADLEAGVSMLAICGGYQLLGNYFLDSAGNRLEGIGYFAMETVAPSADMVQRAVGDLVTALNQEQGIQEHPSALSTLVGFENHSGRTRISNTSEQQILGKVLQGVGDNYDRVSDGLVKNNAVGSYMHGSLLPKNPHLADWLIQKALQRKYNQEIKLAPLADDDAIAAHQFILQRYGKK